MAKQIQVKVWGNLGMDRLYDEGLFTSIIDAAAWLRIRIALYGARNIDTEIPGYGPRVRALAGLSTYH